MNYKKSEVIIKIIICIILLGSLFAPLLSYEYNGKKYICNFFTIYGTKIEIVGKNAFSYIGTVLPIYLIPIMFIFEIVCVVRTLKGKAFLVEGLSAFAAFILAFVAVCLFTSSFTYKQGSDQIACETQFGKYVVGSLMMLFAVAICFSGKPAKETLSESVSKPAQNKKSKESDDVEEFERMRKVDSKYANKKEYELFNIKISQDYDGIFLDEYEELCYPSEDFSELADKTINSLVELKYSFSHNEIDASEHDEKQDEIIKEYYNHKPKKVEQFKYSDEFAESLINELKPIVEQYRNNELSKEATDIINKLIYDWNFGEGFGDIDQYDDIAMPFDEYKELAEIVKDGLAIITYQYYYTNQLGRYDYFKKRDTLVNIPLSDRAKERHEQGLY